MTRETSLASPGVRFRRADEPPHPAIAIPFWHPEVLKKLPTMSNRCFWTSGSDCMLGTVIQGGVIIGKCSFRPGWRCRPIRATLWPRRVSLSVYVYEASPFGMTDLQKSFLSFRDIRARMEATAMSWSARKVTEGTAAGPLSALPTLDVLPALRRGTDDGRPGPFSLDLLRVVDPCQILRRLWLSELPVLFSLTDQLFRR